MSLISPEFNRRYRDALSAYLSEGGEIHLHHAYELGRQALDSGIGILNLVTAHETALANVLDEASNGSGETTRHVATAGRFLMETLSPFELFHLGNQEANMALRRLNAILEEEAKRIAHTLHDEAAQLLATVYLEVAEIAREIPEPVQSRVSRITDHLDQVRDQLRRLSHELRPPILDQLGLLPALRFLADGVQKRSGIHVRVEGDTEGRLPQRVETALYRVCQEALNNVTRHARASHAGIRIWKGDNAVKCVVWDDGVGFKWPGTRQRLSDGLGLIGIQERVGSLHGTLEISPGPEKGTEIRISIPETQS